jgi:hypothetical protein
VIPTRWSSAFDILARRLRRLQEERRLLLELQSTLGASRPRIDDPDRRGGVDDNRRAREAGATAGDAECRESEGDP